MRLPLAVAAALVATIATAATASASQLIGRDAIAPTLAVDAQGRALVTFQTPAGATRRVLAWGATDALPPAPGTAQVTFQVDMTGGWKTLRRPAWRTFRSVCRPYSGPPLPWLVTACTAPDGTHWALQSWRRGLPGQDRAPTALQAAWELRLSHWSGEVAQLEVWQDWKYSARINTVFGRYTYRGVPVHGFGVTRGGQPTDGFGRLVYYDTLDSGYGAGWRRADAMSTHAPGGVFCAVFAHELTDRFGTNRGLGARYRITVVGPGVTPDVGWEDTSLPAFDPNNPGHVRHERAMNEIVRSLADPDPRCSAL